MREQWAFCFSVESCMSGWAGLPGPPPPPRFRSSHALGSPWPGGVLASCGKTWKPARSLTPCLGCNHRRRLRLRFAVSGSSVRSAGAVAQRAVALGVLLPLRFHFKVALGLPGASQHQLNPLPHGGSGDAGAVVVPVVLVATLEGLGTADVMLGVATQCAVKVEKVDGHWGISSARRSRHVERAVGGNGPR